MASNFKIIIHRNSDNLHLKLMGDFDGSSALQLLNLIARNRQAASRVFVHTGSVKAIVPFGQSVFRNNFRLLKGKPIDLVFTGEHASELSPEQKYR